MWRSTSSAWTWSPWVGWLTQRPVTIRFSPGAAQGMVPTTVTTSPSPVTRRRTV